jgi:hypothetical protein
VRTDHYSLKFLLDQRLSTVPQHQWISKLFGFDFTAEYRPGRLNTVADALSRRDTEDVADDVATAGTVLCIRSGPSFAFIDDIRRATSTATDRRSAGALTPASWGRPGAWTMGCFYTGAAFSCPPMVTCATKSCPWRTLQDTRACRRPSIASVLISTFPVMARWSVPGCGHA